MVTTEAGLSPARRPATARASGTARSRRLPKGGWVALAATLLIYGGHLAYGSVISEPAMLMFGAAAIIAAAAMLSPTTRDDFSRLRGLLAPTVLFLLVLAVALWSQTPYVPGGPHPVWAYLSLPPALTIDRSTTFVETVKLVGLGTFFLLGALIGRNDERARLALKAILWGGVVFAMWALLAGASGLIFQTQRPRIEALFMTPNTAGTVFAVLLILSLAELMRAWRSRKTSTSWVTLSGASAALALCLLATASRGAALAFLCAAAVFVVLLLATRNLKPGRAVLSALGGLLLLLVAVWAAGDMLVERFYATSDSAVVRQAIWTPHWAAFLDSPLFGYGLGNFETVNKTVLSARNWDELWNVGSVHNVYLQWLEEAGLVGAVPMFLAVGAILIATLRGTLSRSRMTTALCGLLAADIVFLVHGFSDFALQTPSVAAFFALLLGLQLSLAQSSQGSARKGAVLVTTMARAWPWATLATVALCLWALIAGAAQLGPFSVPMSAALDRKAEKLLADQAPTSQAMSTAAELSKRAVAQYPFDTSAWLRQAYVDRLRHGHLTPAGVSALASSYDLVPTDIAVGVWRVGFVLENTAQAPKEVRLSAMKEASLLWRDHRRRQQIQALPEQLQSPEGRLAARLLVDSLKLGMTY